ncbi:Dynamin-2A [Zea mays]|uniref:Dynamin-2A n=2 Tax=Zea mays TaxID=4577 RepID=A0A1D6Q9Y4_MAIZE|nr:Dynamin-2A [Zea mays]
MKRIVLEADGYQPYLISPEKGLRSLKKGVLEKAKEPSRLCVEEVHRVLLDIVNAAANATPGLGRYPPFKREVIAIASNALDAFKIDAKKMVVALVDMERAFVPPQHFIRLVQRRMERQRREDELKNNRASKKGQDAEQFKMNRASSPQTVSDEGGGNLKSMKDKSNQQDKDTKEGPNLQVAGPGGEITADLCVTLKRSAKNNEWSKRWFVLNEKSGKLGYTKKQEERHFRGVIVLEECNLVEIEEEEISKSSKDSKKANGQDKGPSLVFKITNRVAYKSVLKSLFLYVIWGDTMTRRPADPEEELRWMSQEVRGYVEAVLNSFAANVPKALVLCQVEKSKEDMLNQLYSSIRRSLLNLQSSFTLHKAMQRSKNYSKKTTMLNVGGKNMKNNHPSYQSSLASSAFMTIEQLHMRTIVLELRVAHGLLATLVRTGSPPSTRQQMSLLTGPVHSMRQGQEVLIEADAMKMGMPPLAADAHLTGYHRHHQVGGDTKYVDCSLPVTNQHHMLLPGSHPLQILVEVHIWDQRTESLLEDVDGRCISREPKLFIES